MQVWLCAEFEARGQKSNDEIMERMNALYGPNGFRREYGLCRKCIVAGAVAASPIDDDALTRAIPARPARGAEAGQPFITWSALAVVWKVFDAELLRRPNPPLRAISGCCPIDDETPVVSLSSMLLYVW